MSSFAAIHSVFRTEGVRGMYKGLLLNLIKNPIATAVSFAVNDLIKDYMLKDRGPLKDGR